MEVIAEQAVSVRSATGWTDHMFSAPVLSSATPCVRCHARLNLAVTTLEFFRPMVEQIFAREPWALTH
jgi:hypothetical protein